MGSDALPLEQWTAGALATLAIALFLAGLIRIPLLFVSAAVAVEAVWAINTAMRSKLRMGSNARLSARVENWALRLGIVNVELQPDSLIFKLVALPLPLLLTHFAATELCLSVRTCPAMFQLQLCAVGLALAVRCAESHEWDRAAAAAGARSQALCQLENLFTNLQRKHKEEQAPPKPAASKMRQVKQLVDCFINRVAIKADDFSLLIEANRHIEGEESPPKDPERFHARVKVGCFHVPTAVREQQLPVCCDVVSADGDDPFCARVQRDLAIHGFVLGIRGAQRTGLLPGEEDGATASASSSREEPLMGPFPPLRIRLATPPVLGALLSGATKTRRRISADLSGDGIGAMNANESLMKVVWTLLNRYLAAGAWAAKLTEAELRCAGAASDAAVGDSTEPRKLDEAARRQLLETLQEPWAKQRPGLLSDAGPLKGCSYYDLLALRVRLARGDGVVGSDEEWTASAWALWKEGMAAMAGYSSKEGLFHELHVSMGLSLDIDLEKGAGRVQANLGRLFARLGPKGTQAGLEVIHGVAVDARPRAWLESGGSPASPSALAQQVLVRGGSFLPDREALPSVAEEPEALPTMRLAAFIPAGSCLRASLQLYRATARLLPSPLLGVALPAVLGLLRQDPSPPTPAIPSHLPYIEVVPPTPATPLPGTLLGGMALTFALDVKKSGAVLPLKPQMPAKPVDPDTGVAELDHGLDGLEVSAAAIHASVTSSGDEESLVLSADGATVVAPGGYEVLEPMENVQLGYSAFWQHQEARQGMPQRLPFRAVNCHLPMASLSLSLAVMQVVNKITKTLTEGFAKSSEQASGEEPPADEEEELKRVERLFSAIDVDGSGELDRQEVLQGLMASVCVDHFTLTQQELASAFEEIWTVLDASNDGKVCFEEFCEAIRGYRSSFQPSLGRADSVVTNADRKLKQSSGSLCLSAAELTSADTVQRIGGEEEGLWNFLREQEVGIYPELGGGFNSSPLTIQWKLLRALRDFSEAKSWWEGAVRSKVAPEAPWEIQPNCPVWPAHEVISAAFFSGYHAAAASKHSATSASADTAAGTARSGASIKLVCHGFQLALEDPLSQLRGQRRLSLGAGFSEAQRQRGEELLRDASSCSLSALRTETCKALDLKMDYWHTEGQKYLAFDDDLTAIVSVRGFFGCCMNPFRKDPEYIMEPYGFDLHVKSKPDERALALRFIADTHFVLNVTSSLLLGIKPIVRTLMPPQDGAETRLEDAEMARPGTAPLAHLLQGLGELREDLLDQFKLISEDRASVGISVPREEEVPKSLVSAEPDPAGGGRGGAVKPAARWVLQLELPASANLVRLSVALGWKVVALAQPCARQIHVTLETFDARKVETAPAASELTVFAVGWKTASDAVLLRDRTSRTSAARSAAVAREEEEATSPMSPAQQTISCQSRRELEVVNSCGVLGRLWFDQGKGRPTVGFMQVPSDRKVICTVPDVDSALCIGLADHDGVAKPDLSTFGRYATPLPGGWGLGTSEEDQCCLTASLSIGQYGQARLELLPPLELQNASQLPLRLRLLPPPPSEAARALAAAGSRMAAQIATTVHTAPPPAVVPPGGTYQVPLHMLQSVGPEGSQQFWQVLAESVTSVQQSSLSFAFPLGGSILRLGRKELELRRSLGLALETRTVGGSFQKDSTRTTLQRYSLLLLPGLRVANSLPVSLRVSLHRGEEDREETWELPPGGTADFGRIAFGGELRLSSDTGETASVMLPAAALQSKAKFKELRQEHLDLSSNMACSLHSRWPAGGGPEFVVVGKCILFNKTGLPLVVRESDAAAPVGGLAPGKVAVLRAEVEVRVGVGKVKACDAAMPGKLTLPSCTETLGLRVTAAAHETSKIFNWIEHQVTLSDGSLRLGFANGATPCAVWPLSTHSTVAATEPTLAAGEKDCFTVEDPGRGQRLLFRAPSRKAQGEWISHIRETVAALKAEDEASIAAGWDDSHGACIRSQIPEGLFNTWCSDGIPVQVPDQGEFIITAGTPQAPLAMFLGVQVHPLMGLFTQSKGVTVTPRFVIRNASSSYVQVLPALLPPGNEDHWPHVPSRSAAIVEEHAGRMLSITDFIAQDEEKEAMWVPPGASLALFHFPTRCQASELRKGAKAVALRMPGPPLLQMISVKYKTPLQLDRVSTGGFLPYRDKLVQLGRLPQSLRILAKEGRLLCLRGEYMKDFDLGQVVLSRPAEIWIGLPNTDTVEPASWLLTDWTKAEVVDLRRRQRSEVSMQLYTRHAEAGVLNLNGAGVGCVVFLARSKSEDPSVEMAALGEAAGLPWSRWLSLNSTCESVISLRSGTAADEPSVNFLRCSVQVLNSTAFMMLSDEPPPYRVENWSPTRTLAVTFRGSQAREVLPPLTWCAFDWPVHSKADRDRRLVLQDLATHRKEMYEAEKVGPGRPLKLDEGQEVNGQSAPLSEEGYHEVVLLQDPSEMQQYVTRVASDMKGSFTDKPALEDFLTQFGWEGSVQSLRLLRQALILKRIVPEPKPVLTNAGRQRASICPLTMVSFLKALLSAGGLAAADADITSFVARCVRLPSLHKLLDELPTLPWVEVQKPLEQVYEALLGQREDVDETATVLHLCLRRALLQQEQQQPKSLKQLKPSSLDLRNISAELARDLRDGRGCRTWAELSEQASHRFLPPDQRPRQRTDTADSVQVSDDEAPASEDDQETEALARHQGFSGLSDKKSDASFSSSSLNEDATVGMSEPLTEEGYQAVASLRSGPAMAAFVRRVLMEEGGEVISSAGLLDFAQGFSGELGEPQSFVALHEALLRSPNWARFQTVSQGKLFVDRWFDGASKVFSVRESRHHLIVAGTDSSSSYAAFECWDIDVQLSGAHINFVFQVRSHVLGTGGDVRDTLCDEEQFALTVDHVQLLKRSAQRKVKFLVHHFQIDNMREADKLRPIIVCPEDSGYHSDRRERLHKHKGRKGSTDSETIPFVYFCMEKLPSGILHFKELTLLLQPVIVRLDLVFWVKVGQQLFEWATVDSGSANAGSSAEDREIVAKQVFLLREGGIEVPSSSTTRHPVYFEYFRLGALIAQVEILMPMKSKLLKKRQANSGVASSMFEDEDDEQDAQMLQSMWLSQILARLTHRSHGLVKKVLMVAQKGLLFVVTSVGSGVLSGVGHMTPRFAFPETVFQRTLEDLMPFLYSLVRDYVKTGMYQFWKVLFSINLLGDPVGLTTSVTGGVMKFFRKTGSEVIAGDLKGEGLLSLAQGVVGGTAATAGKFFGALGDTVDALAQTGGDRDRHYQPGSVNHVGDGLTAGAQVFLHGATSGIAGLVQAPVQGFQRKGVVGLATGMLKGAAGLVAKPVSGLMHGVQHVAEGVDATTRLWDHAEQIVRRREPRGLPSGAKLVPLVGAEFSPRITVFLEALEFPTVESFYGTSAVMSRRLRGATYRVELSAQGSGGRWSKASKLGRLTRDGSVAFNEVKWVPTQTLVEADVVVEVQDCALSGDPTNPEPVYRAVLPRQAQHELSVLAQVAKLLRDPEELAALDGVTCRIRPSQPLRVGLKPVSGGEPAELLLRFWPAWDPDRVPTTQRWVPKGIVTRQEDTKLPPPERREGPLEKRSKGAFHHWSRKWVVLENHEFMYWNDRRDFEQGRRPKVRYSLAAADCQYRFAAGETPEACFVQVRSDGLLEAQWRPAQGSDDTAGSWLQAVLRHTIQDK